MSHSRNSRVGKLFRIAFSDGVISGHGLPTLELRGMNKKVAFAFAVLMTLSVAAPASAQSVYSPSEYPTAQGQYLQAPNSYQPPIAAPVSPPLQVSAPPAPVAPPAPPVYTRPVQAPVPAAAQPAQQPLGVVQRPAQSAAPSSYDDMPSYDYNKNMDPAHPTYKTPVAHDSKATGGGSALDVGTTTSYQLGLQISDYRYQEFAPTGSRLIRITGPTVGVTFDGYKAYTNGWFVGGDARVSYGLHDYTGGDEDQFGNITPSTHNGIDDWMIDIRALGGHDFIFRDALWGVTDVDLSPYAGLGFRFLYDDSRGDDSNGVQGYERYSHYLYLPVGVSPRFRLNENSRLSLNMEYDLLLYGWQVSSLGDANPGETDVTNSQRTGYGVRTSVMYERRHWSAGPFFEYWDIGQSQSACNNAGCGFYEPHNETFNFGLQGKYRF